MSLQNIFLDQDIYLKRNLSLDQLIHIQTHDDSRQIARLFISKEMDLTELKDAVSYQIEKVIENLPSKQKPIMKLKFKGYQSQKRQKNGKYQESVKDINFSNSNTEADHEIIDFFDVRDGQNTIHH